MRAMMVEIASLGDGTSLALHGIERHVVLMTPARCFEGVFANLEFIQSFDPDAGKKSWRKNHRGNS